MTTRLRNWKPDRLPALAGKTYLITGGNSGIGLEAAKMLAAAGADIVIACRNPHKAARAAAGIDSAGGSCATVSLDVSSLASVREAAEDIRARWDRLDGLVNNAGIMQPPLTLSADGYELQFATNHLGHFLLSGLLFDLVEAAAGRIVAVSSLAHLLGRIHFDDLMFQRRYNASAAYAQSKLANLMFSLELHRRLQLAGSAVSAVACHPGFASTSLFSTGPQGLLNGAYRVVDPVFGQSAVNGAIPTVLAAAGKEACAGEYYGPRAFGGIRGPVGNAYVSARARDTRDATRLWQVSEELVGLEWGPR
ncbi:MAG: short-chain dehydrogenase [Halioglobus sp.]|nr:short-chain dehydrogenase [Halioglobus sp.]